MCLGLLLLAMLYLVEVPGRPVLFWEEGREVGSRGEGKWWEKDYRERKVQSRWNKYKRIIHRKERNTHQPATSLSSTTPGFLIPLPHSVPSSARWACRALGWSPLPAKFFLICSHRTLSLLTCHLLSEVLSILLFKLTVCPPELFIFFPVLYFCMTLLIFIYLFLFILSNINSIRSEEFVCFAYWVLSAYNRASTLLTA